MKNRVLWLLCLLFFAGCTIGTQKSDDVAQKKLFGLNYGGFEDELDLFDVTNYTNINTSMLMKDGFFFIVNGKAKKIIQLTSYGDLISVYYNADYNPLPSFVNTTGGGLEQTSQQASAYPFNTLGSIAADSHKNLYAVDQLPPERQEQDSAKRLLLRDIVLRFASDGTFIDYLGQQGPGGTPFPYISGLHTTKNNELVVVSVTGTGMLVSWFTPEGFLKYSIPIHTAELPNPHDTQAEIFVSLDAVIPDYVTQTLYLKIDYYQTQTDVSSNVQSDIAYYTTLVYPLNVAMGIYGEPITIPAHEEVQKDGFTQKTYENAYQFLGVTESGWFFFISPDVTGYAVQIVRRDGQKIMRKKLTVAADDMFFNNISLSSDGIISALLCSEFEASVVWWRTDALLANF